MNEPQKLLIILATYNEIDNLPRLVHQINELIPDAGILVIDDASPDGTGNWCEQSKDKYEKLAVIHRQGKLGLGSATVAGIRYGLNKGYDLLATMDADLSHDPVSLVEMVKLIDSSNPESPGVVIGSRYIEGGGTEGWPWLRRFTSKVLNVFARICLGLTTKDNSGAFRVYRAADLAKLDISTVKSTDFAYLEEILWRLKKANVKMIEYPIVFKNRELGRSKTSPVLGVKVFWQILRMGLGLWK